MLLGGGDGHGAGHLGVGRVGRRGGRGRPGCRAGPRRSRQPGEGDGALEVERLVGEVGARSWPARRVCQRSGRAPSRVSSSPKVSVTPSTSSGRTAVEAAASAVRITARRTSARRWWDFQVMAVSSGDIPKVRTLSMHQRHATPHITASRRESGHLRLPPWRTAQVPRTRRQRVLDPPSARSSTWPRSSSPSTATPRRRSTPSSPAPTSPRARSTTTSAASRRSSRPPSSGSSPARRRASAGAPRATSDPWEKARAGLRAFLEAVQEPGYRQVVISDGPSVLGPRAVPRAGGALDVRHRRRDRALGARRRRVGPRRGDARHLHPDLLRRHVGGRRARSP